MPLNSTEANENSLSKPVILIADDNSDSRDALRALLEAYGFSVSEAENGEEAVRNALKLHPDLILMDIMMPRVDGCEATRRLRASEDFRQVPILALTAMVGSQDLAIGAGCDAYLNKPIEIPTLLRTIRSWLEKGRPMPVSPAVNGVSHTAD
jgi:two-component system cell cycle response regulator DivK